MKSTSRETVKTVMQFVVSVLTALLAALGVQSCVGSMRPDKQADKQLAQATACSNQATTCSNKTNQTTDRATCQN